MTLPPGVHCVSLPTPFAVGRVNCWLVEDEPLTLFDCGPNSGLALDELEQRLAALGHRVEDLERIVITHQHIDHLGLIGVLARRSGAEICALDCLAPVVEDFGAHAEEDDALAAGLLIRHGVGADVTAALRAVSRAFRGWGGHAPVATRLADGSMLPFAGRSLQVLHRPGHSPSDTVFWDAGTGVLIGGDHLIGHISSNPLITRPLRSDADGGPPAGRGMVAADADRPRALLTYIASLRRTRELPVAVVLPGHGEPVTAHAELIDERFAGYERRARRIGRLIAERPRTAHEIAHALWGGIALTQAYLTLSEVLGHADLLLERGEIAEREDGGIIRFEAI